MTSKCCTAAHAYSVSGSEAIQVRDKIHVGNPRWIGIMASHVLQLENMERNQMYTFHVIWEFTRSADCVTQSENSQIAHQSADCLAICRSRNGNYAICRSRNGGYAICRSCNSGYAICRLCNGSYAIQVQIAYGIWERGAFAAGCERSRHVMPEVSSSLARRRHDDHRRTSAMLY